MGDDSSRSIVKTLKNEWSLLLEVFQGEEKDEVPLEIIGRDEIKEMTKSLSEDRKKVNQKIESISKEIDLNMAKLESLRLVGAEEESTLNRINELNDLGQSMSEALAKLDAKLRNVREHEQRLQEELASI